MKAGSVHPSDTGKWALPFATVMLLLFSLFLGLYALTKKQNVELNSEILQLKRTKASPPPTKESQPNPATPEGAAVAQSNADLQSAIMNEAREFLSQDTQGRSARGRSDVEVLDLASGDFLVRVAVPDLYAPGSSRLGKSIQSFVDRLGQLVLRSGRRLRIEGHADFEDSEAIQRRSSEYTNTWELSAARSAGLAQYWMRKFELEPSRIEVGAYGKFRPLDPSATRSKQANRRIEVVILRNEN